MCFESFPHHHYHFWTSDELPNLKFRQDSRRCWHVLHKLRSIWENFIYFNPLFFTLYVNLPPGSSSRWNISGPRVRVTLVVLSSCSVSSRVTSLRFLFLLPKQLWVHLSKLLRKIWMSFQRLCYIVSDEIILHSNFSIVVMIFVSDRCLFGITLPTVFLYELVNSPWVWRVFMTGQNFAVNVHLIVVVKESECSDFKLLVIPLGIKVVFHGCVSRTTVGSESKK